jgi:integrase
MAETFQFTKEKLEELEKAAPGKTYEVRDQGVPGLILRVTAAGGKTFYFYRWTDGKAARHMIGKFPDVTIVLARRKAKEMTGQVATGQNPSEDTKRDEWTFSELFDWWEKHHASRKKSGDRDREQYDLHLKSLGRRRLSDIKRSDLRELHADLGKRAPVAANRVMALARAMFNRAIAEEVFDGANPAQWIKPFPELARDRVLSRDEADKLFASLEACDSQQLRDLIQILLFTGQRKNNVLAMAWVDVDLDEKVWRVPMTKNGKPVLVPLLDAEMVILERRKKSVQSKWVFPGRTGGATGHLVEPKNGWKVIVKRAGLEGTDLRMHDLRRSLGSFMVNSGATLNVIGKTLGHKSQAATEIYARLSLEPVKEAKAKALEAMVGTKTAPNTNA